MTDAIDVPEPKRKENRFFVAPVFYPQLLRKIANALDAMTAFEEPDPTNREGVTYVGTHGPLPIYDSESTLEGEEDELIGWLAPYDAACWVFVPYVPEIEAPSSTDTP